MGSFIQCTFIVFWGSKSTDYTKIYNIGLAFQQLQQIFSILHLWHDGIDRNCNDRIQK